MVQSGVLLFFEGLLVVLYLVGAVGFVMIILFPWWFISEKKKLRITYQKKKMMMMKGRVERSSIEERGI